MFSAASSLLTPISKHISEMLKEINVSDEKSSGRFASFKRNNLFRRISSISPKQVHQHSLFLYHILNYPRGIIKYRGMSAWSRAQGWSKIGVRLPALQEKEATSVTTYKQPTEAWSMLLVSNGIWTLKRNPSEPDASSYDLQGTMKGLAICHWKGHFSLLSGCRGMR